MKKRLMISLIAIMAFCSSLFAAASEQDAYDVTAFTTIGQRAMFNSVERFTTPIKVTGNIGVDTIASLVSIPKFAIIKSVWVVVADTVESRGDSALVKLFVGSTEIMSQRTSAFKLGLSTAPRAFNFTASTLYSTIPTSYTTGNILSYRVTQTAGSGGTGITEGTFYMIVEYISPFKLPTLP